MLKTNAIDCIMRAVGQEVWELQITAETAGDTPLDVPVKVKKRHRVYGTVRLATVEQLEKIGTSVQGDALFISRDVIDLTSQLEYKDEIYEITDKIDALPLHTGPMYTYVLHKTGKRRAST